MPKIVVVGGGLAGCEAAFQLAARGHEVELREQKPIKRTPAQHGDRLAELVCSNSLRGAALSNAVGLLKEELRRAGSLILRCADEAKVPAGGALAVDREVFANAVERAVKAHPRITVVHGEVTAIPEERPTILATGPLTGEALAKDLERVVGDRLAYYDAIAPIVAADSIDFDKVFRASRWDKGGDDAYLNCPMDKPQYAAFLEAVLAAEKVEARSFEDTRYFEGCLPIEVMAERGPDTLRFGPMKPVGLTDPRTGRWPWAVVQLRQEDAAATAYNLVGFQSRMTWTAQARVLRMIPGLERAEFLRFGSVHRNTFVHAPRVLDETMQLRELPGVFLAGQVTGVEGYVESAAGGFLCALMLAQRLAGGPIVPPPETTALGGLLTHLGRDPGDKHGFQPSNITWAHVPPMPWTGKKPPKHERYERMAERALIDLERWLAAS
ncbi:MAG: methylenetetrahydrofolate--tRNA-(uracil(54)-C(5))-methyltransferase (FADH(2)-oxidizing) TrmFO [Deltaproteobacteria bacterium]|nr:methylenetetrahydrofolate--tRNA-(uracil(54)-C(5))-methyltransferase (FADH(2)-oxidizing) TrmFO [Deltaproteobacteria bacterium]